MIVWAVLLLAQGALEPILSVQPNAGGEPVQSMTSHSHVHRSRSLPYSELCPFGVMAPCTDSKGICREAVTDNISSIRYEHLPCRMWASLRDIEGANCEPLMSSRLLRLRGGGFHKSRKIRMINNWKPKHKREGENPMQVFYCS